MIAEIVSIDKVIIKQIMHKNVNMTKFILKTSQQEIPNWICADFGE